MKSTVVEVGYRVVLGSIMVASVARAQVGRSISVTGQAEVRVAPSLVNMVFGVETLNRSLSAAKQENDRRVQAVMAAIQALGVPQKDIQTDYIQVQPRYQDTDAGTVLRHYTVRKTVVVALRDVSKFERCMGAALETGANHILGVQFLTSELKKYRDEARSRAIQAAREKAEALARELNLRVGRALSIHDNGWGGPWHYYNNSWDGWRSGGSGAFQVSVQGNAGGGGDLLGEAIALGQISISASISVSFELEAP